MGICHNNKRETSKTNSTVLLSPEGNRVAKVTSKQKPGKSLLSRRAILCEYNEQGYMRRKLIRTFGRLEETVDRS